MVTSCLVVNAIVALGPRMAIALKSDCKFYRHVEAKDAFQGSTNSLSKFRKLYKSDDGFCMGVPVMHHRRPSNAETAFDMLVFLYLIICASSSTTRCQDQTDLHRAHGLLGSRVRPLWLTQRDPMVPSHQPKWQMRSLNQVVGYLHRYCSEYDEL